MLKEQFFDLLDKYSDDIFYKTQCWDEIVEQYSAKSRYYHNLNHLENMFSELDSVKFMVGDLDTTLFAIYYHDIIYKSTKSDNEHRSALFFKERISKTNFKEIEKCCLQIEATKHHKKTKDVDTNILLDIDLSILGMDEMVYKEYCLNVRKEYQIYPDLMYYKGRKKVLKNMLDKRSIYACDYFITKYESKARENINNELKKIG